MTTSCKQWQFEPLDTWFFRESRPHGAAGSSRLESIFPPPARTVAGAIRSLIGEHGQVDWEKFHDKDKSTEKLRNIIGFADDLGQLELMGPYLLYEDKRLYSVPLSLLNKDSEFVRLRPGDPVVCDLGCVRLPETEKKLKGAKPLENTWVTAEVFKKLLAGENLSAADELLKKEHLFDVESRVGIAINKEQRIVEESMLYQTQHVRPRSKVKIGVTVSGITDESMYPDSEVHCRFGGEGRLATVNIPEVNIDKLTLSADKLKTGNVLLVLLTHADLKGCWLPDQTFVREKCSNYDVWRGKINGIELTIMSAILGKAIREGGWDLAQKKPRAVKSLAPAGSVWFCKLKNRQVIDVIDKLQGFKIGCDTALGRGEIAVGVWEE
ncbi:MAG: type III-B CRISPR module-associated protein Cmr3 [Pseudomonadota bacterium]|nr:type III-B CRISPR module-associated protein Cmr3 [Pseudomonadota bacterium]